MSIAFYVSALLTLAGALASVLLKNKVHCALALTVAITGLAFALAACVFGLAVLRLAVAAAFLARRFELERGAGIAACQTRDEFPVHAMRFVNRRPAVAAVVEKVIAATSV